jgi:hypothetical protein
MLEEFVLRAGTGTAVVDLNNLQLLLYLFDSKLFGVDECWFVHLHEVEQYNRKLLDACCNKKIRLFVDPHSLDILKFQFLDEGNCNLGGVQKNLTLLFNTNNPYLQMCHIWANQLVPACNDGISLNVKDLLRHRWWRIHKNRFMLNETFIFNLRIPVGPRANIGQIRRPNNP